MRGSEHAVKSNTANKQGRGIITPLPYFFALFSKNITSPLDIRGSWKPGDITIVSATAAASVESLNGNQNNLTITITELYSDGSKNTVTTTLKINNNSAGTYQVGDYKVYVDTKGNTQIRECYIVK